MPKTLARRVLFLAMVLLAPIALPSAGAGTGDLDPTFATGGQALTATGAPAEAHDAILYLGTRPTVAGRSGLGAEANSTVIRYLFSGDLDTTFGSGGIATVDAGGFDEALDIVLQPDNKFVVVGRTLSNSAILVFRLNTDGTLDATFGSGGVVVTDLGDIDVGTTVLIDPVGNVVVGGRNGGNFTLLRYDPSGALDTSFGTGGVVRTTFPGGGFVSAFKVLLQFDGKLVLVGTAGNDFALARYHTNGTLDTSWGVDGKTVTDFGFTADQAFGAVIQSTGKFVVGGTAIDPIEGNAVFALARYDISGNLDPTFGKAGKVTTKVAAGQAVASDLVRRGDDTLVAAGTALARGPVRGFDFALVGYGPDGALDRGFGKGGKVLTDTTFVRANGAVAAGDGRIIAVGLGVAGASDAFAVARYLN